MFRKHMCSRYKFDVLGIVVHVPVWSSQKTSGHRRVDHSNLHPTYSFFPSSDIRLKQLIRHGPFDILGGGGLEFFSGPRNFFSDNFGERLFFSSALRAVLFLL